MQRPISTLKGWFQTGRYPTQEQFWDWMDSFFHKDEGVLAENITGLQELIDQLAPLEHSHITDNVDVIGTSCGALNEGDIVLLGTPIVDFLRMLLQKVIHPLYLQPELSLDKDMADIVEVGTLLNPNLHVQFTQNDAGIMNRLQILRSGNPILDLPGDNPDYNYQDIDGELCPSGSVEYKAVSSYDEGISDKPNNMGDPDPEGHILSGDIEQSVTITGQYRLFAGHADDSTVFDVNDSAQIRSEFTFDHFAPEEEFSFSLIIPQGKRLVWFCYPSTVRDVSSVKLVESGGIEIRGIFQKSNIQVEDAGGSFVNYAMFWHELSAPYNEAVTYEIII